MPRGERVELGNLTLSNRTAARILNTRGTPPGVGEPAGARARGAGEAGRRCFPVVLRAAQILAVAGCLYGSDRLVLDGKLSAALGDRFQIAASDVRTVAQKLVDRFGT